MKINILIIIIVAITISLNAYDESYIVKQDGTGDFTTLQAAINAVQTSAVIYVYGSDVAYTGLNNKNLSWNGNSKNIYFFGINNPIINCQNSGRAFSITNGTSKDKIENFILKNGNATCYDDGGAIEIINCSGVSINNNIFENNRAFNGGAINISSSNVIISYNQFVSNTTMYYLSSTYSAGKGGAIYMSSGSNVMITNNEFIENESYHGAAAIDLISTSGTSCIQDNVFLNNQFVELMQLGAYMSNAIAIGYGNYDVSGNVFDGNFSGTWSWGVIVGFDDATINNNTFIDNEDCGIYLNTTNSEISIFNNIFESNDFTNMITTNQQMTITYCVMYESGNLGNNVTAGTGCLTTDPLINSITYKPIWDTTTKSPCIDTGDPSITDPDGTPSDIGAIRAIDHDYQVTTATPNRYRYRSFPVLDRTYEEGFTTTYVCQPVEDQTENFEIFDEGEISATWERPVWFGYLNTLNSQDGYKLQTDDEVDIPTSGITLPEDTEIDLNSGENWIGYFVQESMTIDEAFADIWEHLEAVYSEDWAWNQGGVIQPERCALIYGKMYIVYVDAACSFVYGDGPSVPPEEREMTDGFTYSETPVYTPINITELDDPTVEEVGVLLDGECIGATKVEDFPLQILAFPPNTTRGSGNLTFAFYYGNRSYEYRKKYFIVDPNTGRTSQNTIELRPYHFNTISFGKPPKGSQTPKIITSNYPNPFNPTTTISYSLTQKTDMLTLEIYNIKGQKIKTLLEGEHEAGTFNVTWQSKDDNGRQAASGIYLYKLSTPEHTLMKKMLLLK